jgi:hypothetical protein
VYEENNDKGDKTMGQNILDIQHGNFNTKLDTTEQGSLHLRVERTSTEITDGATVSTELTEEDAHRLRDALNVYIESRQTKFSVGDIVYEPRHYKRAGEVILILKDRIYYGAPYRIRFIDQAEGQPETDYFAAEDLVLVQKKADQNG